MRAVRLHRYEVRPVVEEVPEPQVTHPFDVIVRIGGAGLCRTDLHIVEGQWAPKTHVPLPYTLGHENAGWIHAVGSAVEHLQPGDAVVPAPLLTGGRGGRRHGRGELRGVPEGGCAAQGGRAGEAGGTAAGGNLAVLWRTANFPLA